GTSIGVNEKEATKIATGTQAYLAFYYPTNWTGALTASNLVYTSSTQTIDIQSPANWDASCNLTGVASGKTCLNTSQAGPIAAQTPSSRTILTWNGSQGIPFEWSNITTQQQGVLTAGDASPTADRLNYLRGDRTNEFYSDSTGAIQGEFRARDGVLADIVDSSPTWVGPPTSPYAATWKDLLNSSDPLQENSGTQSYTQYLATAQTRLNVVYSGANDGLLHGFRSGSYDSSGNYVNNSTTPNDGQEVLAYMPNAVLQVIHNTTDGTLDYSGSQYSHNFYVDATPEADELFYGGQWHTWLVGGLGPGGAAIYALDVTDPTQFSESNAASLVIGEWTPSSIPGGCANLSNCGNSMGNTYGVPVVRRLHNGLWAIIFGNGYGSATGDAGIFIITIACNTPCTSPSAITKTFYYLSTGTGSAASPNGISFVSPADLDGDHVTDFVYAGDLQGNVWRFDLTSSNPANWAAGSTPLFTTPSGQPITTKLLLAIVPQAQGSPRLMVDFGTGRKVPQTNQASAYFASGAQALYGVWDWNMAGWNSVANGSSQYMSLAAPQTVTTANLQTQTFSTPTAGVRDVTANNVCWKGSTTCSGGSGANTQFGWQISLPATQEQVIFSPLLYQNAFIVNTTIPANNSPTSCAAPTDTGYTIAVNVSTGGSLNGFFQNYHDANAAGSQSNGTGTPFMVMAAGNSYLLTQSIGNGSQTGPVQCPKGSLYCRAQTATIGPTGKRLTWVQRR
ncbi:MAG TPA: PilC/PilY family type IV pilus protein, partial [Steroidobacteraceae bacterium]|nr:PilC/PilY family type IV pilus protein [Steroidobacteraceae bacterium]